MLRGKTLSVPIIHAVHRSKAKDYAMDIQGTTTGFTKLHLKATIISQNVEWRNQAPTIRIRWEITDHHRQLRVGVLGGGEPRQAPGLLFLATCL